MKKLILLSFLLALIPAIVYGQNRVEAPVWNVGDRWDLGADVSITVASADENSYSARYLVTGGDSTLIYEKSTLNRLFSVEKGRRVKYDGRNRRLLNFPLEIGKSWKDQYIVPPTSLGAKETTYIETFTPLGWEDIEIPAGKFKAVKIEYKQEMVGGAAGQPKEGKVWYWYSPDVKYMLKCQYEKSDYWEATYNWELASFKVKK